MTELRMTVWEASTPSKDIPGSEDMGSNQDLARRSHLLRRIDKWYETLGNLHTSFSDISEVMCFYLICTFSRVQENMPSCAWFISYQIGFPGSASVESTCMQKTSEIWVGSLCGEDPLEKNMATHSSILAGESPWTEEPGRLQSMWLQRVKHDKND